MPRSHYASLFALGILAALALPPLHIVPLLIPAFVGLLFLLDRTHSSRSAFFTGWWFGFGHFMVGLYWIAIALLTDITQFGWLLPFTLLGIPAVIAFYTGLVTWLTYRTSSERWQRVLLFAVFWTSIEYVRGLLFTGFPWNLIGYSLAFSTTMLQLTAFTGIYGLSFLTLLLAAMPYVLWEKRSALAHQERTLLRATPLLWIYLLGASLRAGGAFRLVNHPTHYTDTHLRIVQANIAQDHKWQSELQFATLEAHITFSKMPAKKPFQLLIWPESAIPYTLNTEPTLRAYIARAIPPDTVLLTGGLRSEKGPFQIWNSVYALNHQGEILATYDKTHLVPFGEYIPFRTLLPINKITYGSTDFSTGPALQALSLPSVPNFSPLICYEAIFPGQVIDKAHRPAWLLNVTNDAWFGTSSGPYQHLTMAKTRAVEEGLPLIRAANTGISAIVDSYGRVIATLGLNQQGVLEGQLPSAIPSPTLYSRYGDRIIMLILISALIIGLAVRAR